MSSLETRDSGKRKYSARWESHEISFAMERNLSYIGSTTRHRVVFESWHNSRRPTSRIAMVALCM